MLMSKKLSKIIVRWVRLIGEKNRHRNIRIKKSKYIKNSTTKNKELPNMEITNKLSITTIIVMNKSNNFRGF